MRIVKPNGDIVECSVEEYKSIFFNDVIDVNNNINTDINLIDKDKIKCSEEEYKQTAEYKYKNNRKKYSKSPNISSHKRWKKWEDKILKNKSIEECYRLLPNRSKNAIWNRRFVLKVNSRRYGRCIRKNDKRISMMKFISSNRDRLRRELNIDFYDAQKLAMKMYKEKNKKQ